IAARRASSTLRTTRGAFVSLRFVVTVPAGLLATVSSLRYTRPSCRNGGPILPPPTNGAVRNSPPPSPDTPPNNHPKSGSCLQARRRFASQFATTAGGVNLAAGVLAGLVAGRADIFAAPR